MSKVPGLETQVISGPVTFTCEPGAQGVIKRGSLATVHVKGEQQSKGNSEKKVFWDTSDPGQSAFECHYGVGMLITGWDQGCMGMKENETRVLEIPPKEAYGATGFETWKIEKDAKITLTIKCMKIVNEADKYNTAQAPANAEDLLKQRTLHGDGQEAEATK